MARQPVDHRAIVFGGDVEAMAWEMLPSQTKEQVRPSITELFDGREAA
ncbi:MAG TPA: hypothetical protein VF182_10065 [Candidatus Binatia bacterium]